MKRLTFTNLILLSAVLCANAADVNEPNEVSVVDKSKSIRKDVQKDDYELPKGEQSETKTELQKMIDRLNALTFSVRPAEIVDTAQADANAVNDVNGLGESETVAEEANDVNAVEFFNPDPNKVLNPLELADVLFRDKKSEQAVLYYRKVIETLDKNKKTDSHDKPWVLYQLGNCYRNYNAEQAVKMYERLISECPGSQWVKEAIVQKKITALLLKEKETIASYTIKDNTVSKNEQIQ